MGMNHPKITLVFLSNDNLCFIWKESNPETEVRFIYLPGVMGVAASLCYFLSLQNTLRDLHALSGTLLSLFLYRDLKSEVTHVELTAYV
jgi:hypothetical protein